MARLFAAEHIPSQQLILVVQHRQVRLGQRLGAAGLAHHRFHGQLVKAQVIGHMEQIVGKVGVIVGEGAPHIVALAAPGPDQLLELGHNAVIAAVARQILAEAVVDLPAAVQREHHVIAFPVGPLDDLIGDADAVGGQREAEIFALVLLDAAGIGHQLLTDLKVHQRFPAEEIHFQVAAGAAVLHQEIQRPLAGLKAHQAGFAVEFALRGKAVLAIEVTGMGHMKAERLDHGRAVFEIKGPVGVDILGEELSGGGQLLNIVKAVLDVGGGNLGVGAVFFRQQRGGLGAGMPGIDQGDGVIGQLIHRVDAAAVNVQNNIITVKFVLMDHKIPRFYGKKQPGLPWARRSRQMSEIELLLLARLVGNAAAGLAGALAGSLALAAAAVLEALRHVAGLESLNVLHQKSLLYHDGFLLSYTHRGPFVKTAAGQIGNKTGPHCSFGQGMVEWGQ